MSEKKMPLNFCQILTNFQNSFTFKLSGKFAMKSFSGTFFSDTLYVENDTKNMLLDMDGYYDYE